MADPDKRQFAAFMRLRQFGRLQIGRLWGTLKTSSGRYKATIDFLERSYFMRAELNVFLKLCIEKKLFTVEEWNTALTEEAETYGNELAEDWPEAKVGSHSYEISVQDLAKRCKEEEWPP
jgi:hypothetical protein